MSNPGIAKSNEFLKTAFDHFSNNRFSQALSMCEFALKEDPKNVNALNLLSSCYYKNNKLDKAISLLEEAIEVNPKSIDCLKNLELFYRENKQYEKALETINSAIAIDPNMANFHYCAGLAYCKIWQIEDARKSFEKVLEITPQYLDAHIMLGNTLQELGEYEAAMEHFDKAQRIDPYNDQVIYNKSMLQLALGDFKNGFKGYESRWLQNEKLGLPDFVRNKTKWEGFAFADSTLLIMMEQGHGDAIQFSRYIPKVAKMGKNIVIRCTQNLIDILRPLAPEATWINYDDKIPEFNYYVTMMSFPLVFGTEVETIPSDTPYIKSDPAISKKWKEVMNNDGYKVGVCWAGSEKHAKDNIRSIDPHVFSKLFDENPNITFYGLQKGRDEAISGKFSEDKNNFINLAEKIDNFSDTAAIIDHLDLVVSVDTALVHLAGAMAKPVWNLVQFNADWRWLTDIETSPWYPGMRLFRQKTIEDWQTVIDNVSQELKKASN